MGNCVGEPINGSPGRADGSQPEPQPEPASRQPVTEISAMHKYAFIGDNFQTLDQVIFALRDNGLESSNLIVGIDFTKSNEWTGKHTFNGRNLHAIGDIPNPYEQAISIIGRTLSPFDEDNLIPCFGFGDVSTHDYTVFSFYEDHRPCRGLEEALSRYRQIVPHLLLSGPTSFAPIIEVAMDIVEKSGGQYHILVIVADGQFVNFTKLMSSDLEQSQKEANFALAALMETPFQYKATIEFNILGRKVGKVASIVPLRPPLSVISHDASLSSSRQPSISQPRASESTSPVGISQPETNLDGERQACPVCLTNPKNMAFGCGHITCRECSQNLSNCPICRARITTRVRLYGT